MTTKTRFVRLGLMLAGIVAFILIVELVEIPMGRAHVPDIIATPIIFVVGLGVYAGWVRLAERRRPDELALTAALPQGVLGIAIGVVLFGATMAIIGAAGAYTMRGFGSASGLAAAFVPILAGAMSEEVIFRGFLFRTVRDISGTWIAVAVSAVVFGALHAFNPGASFFSSLAIALEAGVLLALSYAATNRLWLPIGLHAGWNYTEGTIFGTPVSGTLVSHALVHGELHGSSALTGGRFGPEASFVAVLVCLAASVVFGIVTIRRERVSGSRPIYRGLQSTGS